MGEVKNTLKFDIFSINIFFFSKWIGYEEKSKVLKKKFLNFEMEVVFFKFIKR